MPEIRYLPENGGQGFIDVIQTSEMSNPITGGRIAFPGYLKVNYLGIKVLNGKQRDYFIPYEGKWKDRELSVTRKSNGGPYLVTGNIVGAARIVVNPVKANLWYGAGSDQVGPVFAQIDTGNPIPDGVYEFSVPDEAHRDYGTRYLADTPYALVWYPIPFDKNRDGKDDARYLHCGSVSAGCITVRDFNYWTKLYNYLYNRRLRDGVVGTITVDSRYTG
jgi:hypothetical protein